MIRNLCLVVAVFLVPFAALAATDVSYWTHSTAADYAGTRKSNVIVTNYGHVQLGRSLQVLAEGVEGVAVVYGLARARRGDLRGDGAFGGSPAHSQ